MGRMVMAVLVLALVAAGAVAQESRRIGRVDALPFPPDLLRVLLEPKPPLTAAR